MKSPTLAELPAPPPGRHGWPWDVDSKPLPHARQDGSAWPKISIVTPSYNQGQYLEETIRSILLQGYPDLEYFVIDGGSTDQSVEIIRKYEPWLAGWVSEKDKGQSEAINKGFTRCTGEIFNWICSDDLLARDSLSRIANHFSSPSGCDVLAGACLLQYDDNPGKNSVRLANAALWRNAPFSGAIWQPACFFRRALIRRPMLVIDNLHYCMDRELWTYLWSVDARWEFTEDEFAVFRFTGANKTTVGGEKTIGELASIYRSYFPEWMALPEILLHSWLPLVTFALRGRLPMLRKPAHVASRLTSLLLRIFYPTKRLHALQHDFYHYRIGNLS